ncbi:MAG: bifunctional phosphopantothenoylcysteine decarboxylase/phosphopantothenate--cysteine ligase CoaBC [Gemmatimonadetes bacterium]|jgi:phosphopantothenoylcysteine decarboxylase/phosphopantothenate--cysteine ligase|nr:bifunctional phosphopantothenoylcysteine decarboxylase/phosphopantothenate--cysteine ligase CoaBC [Gemmatimonadota bacterium]MBK9547619.1 bifunctional phosphopantothenoylcysteine decarboxylase/phosphopantothenate--cysteine ligase CoaBC [Gemmatimonadota bacterium]MBP6444146.1 bifunctional phosphopantothenoylcysteine decarboxylase/phosphopantothenate--cysteine ligase CoaBC [Gemmatimonadales bacterium]
MWRGRRVVLGVTGGIAAYKSVLLARDLTTRGALVDVILTRGATEFIGVPTFEAVTRRPVRTSLWERDGALDHVTLGESADLILVAPATAHLLARAALGMADDLLTATLLAAKAPVLIAPAMNDEMYADEATTANLALLRERGWRQVGPVVGALAEGPSDRPGRMAEPSEIVAHAERVLAGPGPLLGLKVVVTAGPTREGIDPVRVITNRSSGKMGYRIAEAAWRRGAEVTLITGPSSEAIPVGVTVRRVETTHELKDAVAREMPSSDVLVMAAAPADYRPVHTRDTKLPRSEGGFTLAFESTEDILVATMPQRHAGLTVVGFALETGAAIERGRMKLTRKQLDMIVINDALEAGAGFDVDTNAVTILDCQGGDQRISLRSKADVAEAILDAIEQYRG